MVAGGRTSIHDRLTSSDSFRKELRKNMSDIPNDGSKVVDRFGTHCIFSSQKEEEDDTFAFGSSRAKE